MNPDPLTSTEDPLLVLLFKVNGGCPSDHPSRGSGVGRDPGETSVRVSTEKVPWVGPVGGSRVQGPTEVDARGTSPDGISLEFS